MFLTTFNQSELLMSFFVSCLLILLNFLKKMKKFKDAVSTVNRIKLPFDRSVRNAFLAYESSWETLELKSEQNRKIYCELIDHQIFEKPVESAHLESKKIEPLNVPENEDENEEDEEEMVVKPTEEKTWWNEVPNIDTKYPGTLGELAIERYAKSHKSGPIDDRIQCRNACDFGMFADIELPIMDLLELEVNIANNQSIVIPSTRLFHFRTIHFGKD